MPHDRAAEHPRRAAGAVSVKRHPLVATLLFSLVALLVTASWWDEGILSIYGVVVFAILGTKLFLSLLPATKYREVTQGEIRAGGVVTIYNEDPASLRRSLDSLLAQSHQLEAIALVDDASSDRAALDICHEFATRRPDVFSVIEQPVNRGKRHALAAGFRLLEGRVDVFVGIDCDTILEPDAIAEGLRPFTDEQVMAATGVIVASNHERNLLTRLIDVRYINGFLSERAAYSKLGAVLCVSGALAFYRASVITPNIERFLGQRFMGEIATVGDDRHLTNLALTQGKVVLAENSIGSTAVPERFGHYRRQQLRWGRSFFRESWWALRHHPATSAAWWLTLIEVMQWFVFTNLIVFMVVVHPILTGRFLLGQYLIFVGLMAMARSVRYFDMVRATQSSWSKTTSFAITPIYGLMNLFVMLPLRLCSLLTLKSSGWGTRATTEIIEDAHLPETTSAISR